MEHDPQLSEAQLFCITSQTANLGNDLLDSSRSEYRHVKRSRLLLCEGHSRGYLPSDISSPKGARYQSPGRRPGSDRAKRKMSPARATYVGRGPAANLLVIRDDRHSYRRCPALTGLGDLMAARFTQGVALGSVISPPWGSRWASTQQASPSGVSQVSHSPNLDENGSRSWLLPIEGWLPSSRWADTCKRTGTEFKMGYGK